MFCVKEDIPGKLLSVGSLPAEYLFVEINLRKRKWLVPAHTTLAKIS